MEGWLEISHPDEWLTLPDGAIVIVDELQDFWPSAAQGSRIPEPILELSKHGKRGFDFYFITQDPTFIHNTPRKLTQTHYHVVRVFGAHAAMIHKFPSVEINPDKVKKKAESTLWPYKKEYFDKYKSADVHNVRRQIPKKVLAIPFICLLAIAAIAFVFYFGKKTINDASNADAQEIAESVASVATAPSARALPQQAPITAEQLIKSHEPRLGGLPQTAPRYDALTAPSRVPRPAACLQMQDRCECYTQQGTKLALVEPSVCRSIVKNGYFQDWSDEQQLASSAH